MMGPFRIDSLGEHPTLFSARDEGIVFEPGDLVAGRFEVIRAIGGGGMGIVYQVRDQMMSGEVKALKVMLPSLMRSENAQQRFVEEARFAQKLQHPNIVNTFDLGSEGDIRFLTMECLDGRSLFEELQARRKLPLAETLQIADALLGALAYAHRTTIHRDIKPQNIFLCKNGVVKLLDFGLARVASSNRFTQSSMAIGTAGYMAPEQLTASGQVSPRSDLYSLGVVLYQCVTGQMPLGRFRRPSELDPSLPGWFDRLMDSLLSTSPDDRPTSAVEVRQLFKVALAEESQETAPTATPPVEPAEPRPFRTPTSERVTFSLRLSRKAMKLAGVALGVAFLCLVVGLLVYGWRGPSSSVKPHGVATAPKPGATPKGEQGKAGEVRSFSGIEMVWIPPGAFNMGSPANENGRNETEGPQHTVTISKGFWLGKYEVTQAQWQAVMGNNPSHFTGDGNLPVERVSWYNCQEFIGRLNAKGEGAFRLPSEAEWEYACRAGTTTAYYFGDDSDRLGDCAWYGANSGKKTHPVGQKKPNAWGLYDMHGNAWEWCQDWYHDSYIGAPTDGSAWESPAGRYRVFRGGSWDNGFTSNCRAAYRRSSTPDTSSYRFGFRVVRTP